MTLYEHIKEKEEAFKFFYKNGLLPCSLASSYDCYEYYKILLEEDPKTEIREASKIISKRLFNGKMSFRSIEQKIYYMNRTVIT